MDTAAAEASQAEIGAPVAINRPLFVGTILLGSFLLFMVQPMVARMALPRLGGAPNVWNSAMLVYQALLLGGYGYAHWLGRLPVKRQAQLHVGLFVLAALTLPIHLVGLSPPQPGWEVLWVPLLFFASIGPVFLLVSAQAPLMQRWYASREGAGNPYALYAASNLGSFTGLIAYPLLVEPYLRLNTQAWGWSVGYVALVALVGWCGWNRREAGPDKVLSATAEATPIGKKRIALWLGLAAVPSGLMLSTTTHLTTDIFAMPLLWVIPLGLYLLSFVVAFSERRSLADLLTLSAPFLVILAGGAAMTSSSTGNILPAIVGVVLLFVVAVALHSRLYDLRPAPEQLTLFYFVMSAGGALGGLFCALIAPEAFDWAWEHPLLVLAAACLLPLPKLFDWRRLKGLEPSMARVGAALVVAFSIFVCAKLMLVASEDRQQAGMLVIGLGLCGLALTPWRWLYVLLLAGTMVANTGWETARDTWNGVRARSYFGIYTVRDYADRRIIAHGTTLHGQQRNNPAQKLEPTSYYGHMAGVGAVLDRAPQVYGANARIGVVGLGAGTLACYKKPGQRWTFFEIDPRIEKYSRDRTFTFLEDCAPDARMVIGDARIELEKLAPASFDVLVIDAFSSDSIPLHLLTDEALGVYLRALQPDGTLLIHISNRYFDLKPVIAALADKRNIAARIRTDHPVDMQFLTPSEWVVMAPKVATVTRVEGAAAEITWDRLPPRANTVWTDDHASVLPFIDWGALVRQSH